LSADEGSLEGAQQTMVELQQRLQQAGIELDQRFTSLTDRLAELRWSTEKMDIEATAPSRDGDTEADWPTPRLTDAR
jgi:hypothetical protein